ncbi:hypothetical protein LTR67_000492 [Exophiala xenobiotica]|nr:hypothetical protein LTR92_000348 [Exophiala xenobiotica]KAK5210975.1 hypothetical protein LTR41_003587 [Exophiala xenobiotica]KAK5237429.1 hypothetical protein LTR47_001695 [Exophiala xenobiotica]KAK5254652.1 hypothetical protein LTS06_001142 [Exophiala xenobiotica]KAK5284077.1 hypothetical protein LTR40_000841 [Exophiala xenobiotica]
MPSRKGTNTDRRNPCTHTKMTRLYDPYGSFRCSMCHKHPNIGWLYRCTQDSGGFLPESDFTGESSHIKRRDGMDVAAISLSNSIIEAIGQGHYTNEQIKSLLEQKERVRILALGQDNRPTTASTCTTDTTASSFTTDRSFSTLPQSTTFSTTSSASLDEEIRAAYDWKELQKVWMSAPSLPPPQSLLNQDTRAEHTWDEDAHHQPPCNFMVCPTCRPTYRERAYLSLEAVLHNPVQFPPVWELENRPISDAQILARIHVPQTDGFYDQHRRSAVVTLHSVPGVRLEDEDEFEGLQHCNMMNDTDNLEALQPATDAHSVRQRNGFRHTVRKALARARVDDSAPKNIGSATDTSRLDVSEQSGSMIFRRRRSHSTSSFVQRHGLLVDTSVLQDSVTLMLARNTPLPHTPIVGSHQSNRIQNSGIDRAVDRPNPNPTDMILHA